ncbi:MAG: BatA and WFA domain-containing protein, partial [Verrucomicrobiota bacterium]
MFGVLAAALVLPLVIHLLNKSIPRFLRFPSIELIKQTMARRSKLYRWRHLILLLLRTAFLGLLLLAFLRPVLKRFGADPAARGGRHVLIVLDHSLSMEHRGDGPTSRERAAHEALKLVDSLGVEDAVNILLMDPSPASCFVDFSKDHSEAKRFLGRLKPGLGRADVNLANTLAARLTAKEAARRSEIYYISDFQRKNWA